MTTRPFKCIPLFLLTLVIASCAPGERVLETATPQTAYWPTHAWRESTPAEQGMDPEQLSRVLSEIDEQRLAIDGLVIIRHGYIVTESYGPPYDREALHDTYSVTKSVISALIGIAIHEGYIKGVDDPVLDYFSERDFEHDDAIKRSITLEHLLTMSAGLAWDMDEMIAAPDWVQYVLDQPVTAEPGTEFFYSSGNAHVLSAIIQQTSGLSARDFAQRYLFDPLGIDDVWWEQDGRGVSTGGWGMLIKPRDMTKIGYLYLQQGMWDGQQIIPPEWIQASTQRAIQVPEPLEPWDLYMGYLWWVHEDGMVAAHGMRGQFIYVIPEYDLVVVMTGDLSDADFVRPELLIRNTIITAVQSPAG